MQLDTTTFAAASSKSARLLQDDTPVHSYRITEVWGEVFNVGLRFWASVDGNDTCAVSQLAMVHVQHLSTQVLDLAHFVHLLRLKFDDWRLPMTTNGQNAPLNEDRQTIAEREDGLMDGLIASDCI